MLALIILTVAVTILSPAFGMGCMSTSFVKTLGKTLCLCLAALAMDIVLGYTGILSLGHMAFYALEGSKIGQWLMYVRAWVIVVQALSSSPIPPKASEIAQGVGTQIFGVVGGSDIPMIWSFAHSLPAQLALVVLLPGVLAYILLAWVVSGKFGSVIRAFRDDEARVRFLGYPVEGYKLFVFAVTAVICGLAGALYYPQTGIINPAELAPIASIYLAVWVAIGGRGRLYGSVIGAAFVSLLSSWFTGGRAPSIPLGFYTIEGVDWWQVLLGLYFVGVTLWTPKGIGGLFDRFQGLHTPDRKGAPLGPDDGSLQEQEAVE